MTSYLSSSEINDLGFRYVGENARISKFASFYRTETISVGPESRIDDFAVVTGGVSIGSYCHITPHCILTGSSSSQILISDFCTIAYRATLFSQTDDYLGPFMTGSVVLPDHVNPLSADVFLGAHSIIGASAIVMPGASLATGTAVGAMSLVKGDTEPWSVYAGVPARKIRLREQFPDSFLDHYKLSL